MSAMTQARPAWGRAPLLMGAILLAWLLAITAEVTGEVQWVHHHRLVVDGLALWASLALILLGLMVGPAWLPDLVPDHGGHGPFHGAH